MITDEPKVVPYKSHPEQHGHWDVEDIARLLHERDALRSRLEAVQRAAYGMTEALRIIGGGFIPGDFSLDPSDFHERMWVWGQRTAKEAIAAYHAATSAEKEVGK